MNFKKVSRAAAIGIVSASLALSSASFARAEDDPAKGAAPNYESQSTFEVPQPDTPAPRSTVWAAGTLKNSTQRLITPPGGKSGNMSLSFNSKVTNLGGWIRARVDGTSSAKWLGSSPVNASSVTLSDRLWATALGVASVNVSANPGVGLTLSGGQLTFSNTVNNTWQNNHNYSNYVFSGLLFTVNQAATSAIRFGSTTYTDSLE